MRLFVFRAHEVDNHENNNEGNKNHAHYFHKLPHKQQASTTTPEYCLKFMGKKFTVKGNSDSLDRRLRASWSRPDTTSSHRHMARAIPTVTAVASA